MQLTMVRGDNAAVIVGSTWVVEFYTTDLYGFLGDSEPVVTVTLPDGTTDVPDFTAGTENGVYQVRIDIPKSGRYIAAISSSYTDTKYVSAEALPVTSENEMPTAGDVLMYLGRDGEPDDSWSVQEVNRALAAERSAQARRCRIPATYPPDLRQALLRRVQRALALSQQPRIAGFDDGEAPILPTNDPEVRRLESPYKKVILG
jgi:hypothetical protein